MNELKDYRKLIDETDAKLLELFMQRMELAAPVARVKRENCMAIEDKERENSLILEKTSRFPDTFDKLQIREFFSTIIELSKMRQKKEYNIYLTGMPYSGKSTLLKKLRCHVKRQCVDIDSVIEQHEQRTVAEIFKTSGEAYFRTIETQLLKELACEGSLIVATGGGILTISENKDIMQTSGYCVLCDRQLEKLKEAFISEKQHMRPLIKTEEDLEVLYFERFRLYRENAHLIVDPNVEDAYLKVIDFMEENGLC